jgi:hypothetical protein
VKARAPLLRDLNDDTVLPPWVYLAREQADVAVAARAVRVWLTDKQLILQMLQRFVAAGDRESLTLVCKGQTALHAMLDQRTRSTGVSFPDLEPPYRRGETSVVHAMRALAALALALGGPRDRWLNIASEWFTAAATSSRVASPIGTPPARLALAPAVRAALEQLPQTTRGVTLTIAAHMQQLTGATLNARSVMSVGVLLDAGQDHGEAARLVLSLTNELPTALVPDPRHMSLFHGDPGFQDALDRAWLASDARRLNAGVLWSIRGYTAPVTSIYQESLGGAFAVALHEIVRVRNPARRLLLARRLLPGTAIVGRLDDAGVLRSVGGYESKIPAARADSRVIVPTEDLPAARAARSGKGPAEIIGVQDWRDAARAARKWQKRAVLRLSTIAIAGLAVAVVALVIALNGDTHAAHSAQLRSAAAHLANEAREIAPGQADGTGLLLAMASDKLAQQGGEHTDTFEDLAENDGTLVRILYPNHGGYEQAAISPDGQWALLATNTGTVKLIDTSDGASMWEHTYPPGLELVPNQIAITALAFSADGQRAAFASSDRSITVLTDGKHGWQATGRALLPVPLETTGLTLNLNFAESIAFSGNGEQLAAYSNRLGLYRFNVANPAQRLPSCRKLRNATSLESASDGWLLIYLRKVARLGASGCTPRTALRSVAGTRVEDAVQIPGQPVQAVTVGEGKLDALTAGKKPEEITNVGPLSNIRLSRGEQEVRVTASTSTGTFGWSLAGGGGVFGFRASGSAVTAEDRTIWLHDGVAEIQNNGSGTFAAVNTIYDPAVLKVAWANKDDLVIANYAEVAVVPRATTPQQQLKVTPMPVPESGLQIQGLAADPTGSSAAAIVFTAAKQHPQVLAWNVASATAQPVAERPDDNPLSLGFAGGDLYIGWKSATLQALEFNGVGWVATRELQMPGLPLAITPNRRSGELDVLTAKSIDAPPSVVRVSTAAGRLRITAIRALDESGAVGLGQITTLADGEVVVAYGTGTVYFLSASLQPESPAINEQLGVVSGLAEAPHSNEVIIAGLTRSAAIGTTSHESLSNETWGTAGIIETAAASPNSADFATGDNLGAKITIWSLREASLRQRACAAIGRNLTRDEWQHYLGALIPYEQLCPKQPERAS